MDTCDDQFVVYNHSRLRYQLEVLENDSDDYIRLNPAANYSNGTSRDNLFNDSNQFLGSLLWTDTNPLVFFDPRTEGEGTYTYTPRYWHEGIGESGEMAVTVLATENPTANVDIYTVPRNESLRGNLFENDLDRGGNPFGQISHRVSGPDIRELRTNDYAAEGTFGLVVTNFQRSIDFGGTTVPTEHGNLLITTTGDFSYTPNEDFVGVDTFSYIIGDERGESRANVNIKVEEVATTPEVSYEYTAYAGMLMDSAFHSDFFKDNPNASSIDRFTLVEPEHGVVNLSNPTGRFTYRSQELDFRGEDSFSYEAIMDDGTRTKVTNRINVVARRNPIARDDSYSTTAGESLRVAPSSGIFANDTDAAGNPITNFRMIAGNQNMSFDQRFLPSSHSHRFETANGSVVIRLDGEMRYTPTSGFEGTDTFDYVLTNDFGESEAATVSVSVTKAPSFANDDIAIVYQGVGGFVDVLANDEGCGDRWNNTCTITSYSIYGVEYSESSQHSTEIGLVNSAIRNQRIVEEFSPFGTNLGSLDIEYTVQNLRGEVDTAVATIEVVEAEPPQLNDDPYTLEHGRTFSGNVFDNDRTGDGGKLINTRSFFDERGFAERDDSFQTLLSGVINEDGHQIDRLPVKNEPLKTRTANGSLEFNYDGSFHYSPNDGFSGVDSFSYTSQNRKGEMTASVTFNVSPPVQVVTIPYRLNVGGDQYEGRFGQIWSEDEHFTLGNVAVRSPSTEIDSTVEDGLFHSERWGDFTYSIPINDGLYFVELLFAETSPAVNSVGERLFDVFVENRQVERFDPLQEAGGKFSATSLSFGALVGDGTLDISFGRIGQAPMLNGIYINYHPIDCGHDSMGAPLPGPCVRDSGVITPPTQPTPNEPIVWRIEDGGNGHTYQPMIADQLLTWQEAQQLAEAMGGDLVSITSQEENEFVFGLINHPMYWSNRDSFLNRNNVWWDGPYIGALQPSNAVEPDGDWQWSNGDQFQFTAWRTTQPDDFGGQDASWYFDSTARGEPFAPEAVWDDVQKDVPLSKSFVVEFEAEVEIPRVERDGLVFNLVSDEIGSGFYDATGNVEIEVGDGVTESFLVRGVNALFDGGDDSYIVLKDDPVLDAAATGQGTIASWVFLNAPTEWNAIVRPFCGGVAACEEFSRTSGIELQINEPSGIFGSTQGFGQNAFANAPAPGSWFHVAFTWREDGDSQFFVNGNRTSYNEFDGEFGTNDLGAWVLGFDPYPGDRNLEGQLHDFAIFDTSLGEREIEFVMLQGASTTVIPFEPTHVLDIPDHLEVRFSYAIYDWTGDLQPEIVIEGMDFSSGSPTPYVALIPSENLDLGFDAAVTVDAGKYQEWWLELKRTYFSNDGRLLVDDEFSGDPPLEFQWNNDRGGFVQPKSTQDASATRGSKDDSFVWNVSNGKLHFTAGSFEQNITAKIVEGEIILSGTDARVIGLDFVSESGLLVPSDAPNESGFSFALSNTVNQITYGNLGPSVIVDGEFRTGVRYAGDDAHGLSLVWGDASSLERTVPIEFVSSLPEQEEPILTARVDPDGHVVLLGDNVSVLGLDFISDSGNLDFIELEDQKLFDIALSNNENRITLGNLGAVDSVLVGGEQRLPVRILGNDIDEVMASWGSGREAINLPIEPLECGLDRAPGDLNGDGSVGFVDFLVLSENFGDEGRQTYSDGDINCDNRVGFADFLVLADNFGIEV